MYGRGLRGYRYGRTEYRKGSLHFVIKHDRAKLRCAYCGSEAVVRAGTVPRQFRTLPIGSRPVWLKLDVQRRRCRNCDRTR